MQRARVCGTVGVDVGAVDSHHLICGQAVTDHPSQLAKTTRKLSDLGLYFKNTLSN
jgi:hypothetical protein